jgi:hypothetical protein
VSGTPLFSVLSPDLTPFGVAPGLYFARFTAPGFEAIERFVIVR